MEPNGQRGRGIRIGCGIGRGRGRGSGMGHGLSPTDMHAGFQNQFVPYTIFHLNRDGISSMSSDSSFQLEDGSVMSEAQSVTNQIESPLLKLPASVQRPKLPESIDQDVFSSDKSEKAEQPKVAADFVRATDDPATKDDEGAPKVWEADKEALRKMHDSHSSLKNKSDRFAMCQLWAHPVGSTRPVMVLTMNELVNSDDVFIPGEIALTPFTVRKGLNLNKIFWTLVDPATNIPKGYRIESFNNAREFGLPHPSDFYDGKGRQNYRKIVEKMDAFIKENSQPAFIEDNVDGGGRYFLFCEKNLLPRFTIGLDWLYSKGGKGKCPHKIIPIETVLIVLSLGGFEKVAERRGGSVMENFPQVVDAFNTVVNEAVTTRNSSTSHSMEVRQTVENLLRGFTGSVSQTHFSMYSSLGGVTARLASTRFLDHPYAFLGAFMYEDQATRYLNHNDFLHLKHLACEHHRDEGTEMEAAQGKKKAMKMKMVDESSPSHKMLKCAKSNGARIVFLVLDVMLVNYGFRPNLGRHFPRPHD